MSDNNPAQYLLTKYVFIDTEAFRKEGFDWTGKTLSKLIEFARQGHLRLLTTEVTKREITSQLHEMLAEATAALKKYEVVLRQAGPGEVFTTIFDDSAVTALNAGHSLSFSRELPKPSMCL